MASIPVTRKLTSHHCTYFLPSPFLVIHCCDFGFTIAFAFIVLNFSSLFTIGLLDNALRADTL